MFCVAPVVHLSCRLNDYVRRFHGKGVTWNMDGEDYITWLASNPKLSYEHSLSLDESR